MDILLPTIVTPLWKSVAFLDAVREAFNNKDEPYTSVRMYFYGVTRSGWREIRNCATAWMKEGAGTLAIYAGTDHALTDPEALKEMVADGVKVYLVTNYLGIFHPKVFIFSNAKEHLVLTGSNNLTSHGLASNIEFAAAIRFSVPGQELENWEAAISAASETASDALIHDYAQQRSARQKALQAVEVPWQFTWRGRRKPVVGARREEARESELPIQLGSGALLYEVMPKETGLMGSQIQILKNVATSYFGLQDKKGKSKSIRLKNIDGGESRTLTMTFNPNSTMRLSIHEAAYTERPCFLIFRKESDDLFEFAVVSEATEPAQYHLLDQKLGPRRKKRRRWAVY